jgi:hypothetical protein
MRLRGWSLALAALFLALTVVAPGGAPAQEDQQAIVRVVHAVPDGPAVDVLVDNDPVFTNVAYRDVTDYAAVPAGAHNVRVVQAGAAPEARPLIDTTVNLGANTYNTIAAVGRADDIQAQPLEDSNTLPLSTRSSVRVVHAAPEAPAVDVAVQEGPVLFPNVSFTDATQYRTVAAETVNLEVRAASTQDVVLEVPDLTLHGATVYSIFAVGLGNEQAPLEAVVAIDAPLPEGCEALEAREDTATPQGDHLLRETIWLRLAVSP